RSTQLLVAASPSDAVADTHWYRPELDHFLVQQARELGMIFLDEAHELHIEKRMPWEVIVQSGSKSHRISGAFAIDASGANGSLGRELGLIDRGFAEMPETAAVFAHFRNVARLEKIAPEITAPGLPYPP